MRNEFKPSLKSKVLMENGERGQKGEKGGTFGTYDYDDYGQGCKDSCTLSFQQGCLGMWVQSVCNNFCVC